MRKLIKNSTVYLVEKVKLTVFLRAYIMMKQVRKPFLVGTHYKRTGEKTIYFIVGTHYQRTINSGTLVSHLISSCGNNHYISLVVQI